MIHAKLLGGLLSAVVGAGIIGGITHLVLGENSGSDENKVTERSFFAVAIEAIKKDDALLQKSCSVNTDCAVYKLSGSFVIPKDKSQKTNIKQVTTSTEVKTSHQYILKLTSTKLNSKDQVEIAFSETDKHLFEIKSSATLTDDNSVKPSLPKGILPQSEMWIPKQFGGGLSNWPTEQLESRKYYVDLYPTIIEREPQNHEDFLVMSWHIVGPHEPGKFYWSLKNGEKLDKFIFKPIEDQLRDKDDNSVITIDLNSKEQSIKAVLEIYEIQDQEKLKNEFAAKTTDRHERFTPSVIDWDEIARESVMVTKLTALEQGKYYKFVFKDYKNFSYSGDESTGITSLNLKKVYADGLVNKLFEVEDAKTGPIPSVCSYVKSKPTLTYCKWMFGE